MWPDILQTQRLRLPSFLVHFWNAKSALKPAEKQAADNNPTRGSRVDSTANILS
jgi:hypothetical protein